MKTPIHILLLFILGIAVSSACTIDGGEEGEEGEVQLPSGIVQGRDGDNFTYSISDVYGNYAKTKSKEAADDLLFHLEWIGFKDGLTASFDLKKRTFRLATKKPLSGILLRELSNYSARVSGDLPYWSELQARDLPKAPDYAEKNFSLKPMKKKLPEPLAWFGVGEDGLRLPIKLNPFRKGTVWVTRTTAYCMCHSLLAIRVLDESGRLLWKSENFAPGSARFALTQSESNDGWGQHDVLIDVDDHGFKSARYRLIPNFNEATPPPNGR